jgi:hypothetical protein
MVRGNTDGATFCVGSTAGCPLVIAYHGSFAENAEAGKFTVCSGEFAAGKRGKPRCGSADKVTDIGVRTERREG